MIKEVTNTQRNVEVIQELKVVKTKVRDKILNRQSKAANFKSWSETTLKLFRSDNRKNSHKFSIEEVDNMLQVFLNKYLEYHPTIKLEQMGLKGKSSFEYKEEGHIIEITTYQKNKPIVTTLEVSDINYIEEKIRYFSKTMGKIKSKVIALCWAEEVKEEIMSWDEFFANRSYHNYLTKCLSYLRETGVIEYEGGIISLKLYKD